MTSSSDTEFDRGVLAEISGRVGEMLEGAPEGRGRRVGLALARFNGGITARLLRGAVDELLACGVDRSDVSVAWVPGAFELPMLALAYASAHRPVDAVITLGAVIRGDTGHYDLVAGECARGVLDVQLRTGVPVIFGVLTTDTVEQALERSRDDETNKGREAARSALEMVSLLRQDALTRS